MRRAAPYLTLAVLFAVATFYGPFSADEVNDLFVYGSLVDLLQAGNVPFRDFPFEYPPLAALPIWLPSLLGGGETTYEVGFAALMLGAALAVQALGAALGGRQVAWLLALQPIVIGASLRTHFDLVPVALTLAALVLLTRDRPVAGFAVLAFGTLTKLFPVVLVPVALAWLLARGERRHAVQSALAFAAVVLVVSLPFASGYDELVDFHLERPVQIESTPASVLWIVGDSSVTGDPVRHDRFKSNGLDGGPADAVQALFAVALAAALAGATLLAARRPADARRLVLASFAALLAFVALGKVFSPQYVIWLAPFAAIAWAWGERWAAGLTAAGIALTQVEFPTRYFDLVAGEAWVVVLVATRNALLLAALTVLVLALARAPARSRRLAAAASTG